MNPVYISALYVLCGSGIGALASVATALTILFQPTVYAFCFRRSLDASGATASQEASRSDERLLADTAACQFALNRSPCFGVRPSEWTGSSGGFDRVPSVVILEL